MMSEEASWGRRLGSGLAHVQHAVDNIFLWGFRKVRDLGAAKDSPRLARDHPALRRAARVGKGLLSFLGEAGDAYYRKYAELKKPQVKDP